MEWSDDQIICLRQLWAEGHSTAEVGRHMGLSKNAVVGKAHRLDLPARPSPIRRDGERSPPTPYVRRTPAFTLPSLASLAASMVVPTPIRLPATLAVVALVTGGVEMSPAQNASLARRPPQKAQEPKEAVPVASAPPPEKLIPCCWPLNDGLPKWQFCGAQTVRGKPYCVAHNQLAYVRVRDRRDDQAA